MLPKGLPHEFKSCGESSRQITYRLLGMACIFAQMVRIFTLR